MASVFSFEIYDEIIELMGYDEKMAVAKRAFLRCSLVCHSWRWKCRPLVWRVIKFGGRREVPDLFAFRGFIVSAPHLAELVEEVHILEFRTSPPDQGSTSIVEVFYSVIAKHLPRLTKIMIETMMDPLDWIDGHVPRR
ncbi:hypothetical protein LXA43DRAFT_481687 [Ganoderma leucocontextum]|nr:hypothetical protein LXA43DRAFT_481687 [Ganoderma leucocontextum]